MKAAVYFQKQIKFEDALKPQQLDHQVLIKVKTASFNAADYRMISSGLFRKRKIFGADISGVVEAIGSKVQNFKIGDEVMVDLSRDGFGGFAQFAVASEKMIVKKPQQLNFEQAAAMPMASVTALQALKKGNIQKDKKILIVGSSGGVGFFALQLAKYFGGHVTCVCSTRNVDLVKKFGADNIIDYQKEDFSKLKEGFDLILVVNGNYSIRSFKRLLKTGGTCILVGGSLKQFFKFIFLSKFLSIGSKKLKMLLASPNRTDLEFVANLAAKGQISPVIDRKYSLEQTAEAYQYIQTGHAQAKVLIQVD